MSKRFLLVGLISVVTFIGAMIAGLLALRPDATQAKEEFTRMFEDATGCHLQVASVQPDGILLPAIRMSGLTLFNAMGDEVGQLRWLQADLSLSMLASGKLGFTRLQFVEPVLDARSFQDCFKNIQIAKVEKSDFPNNFEVDIERGRLLWSNNPFDKTFELENISLSGNWDGQKNLRLAGMVSKKGEERYSSVPLKTSLRFSENGADRFRFEAFEPVETDNPQRLINFVLRPNVDASVSTDVKSEVILYEGRLSIDLPEASYLPIFKESPLGQWPLSFSADFVSTQDQVKFEKLEGKVDEESFTADMEWERGRASVSQLHLDVKLGLISRAKNLTNFTVIRGLSQLSNISEKLAHLPFELDLGLIASGITSQTGELARAPALHFTAGLGSVTLDQMNITLPGETEFSLLADFVPNEGSENSWFASGGLSIQSTNLRRSLKWLGIDSSGISPDQLRHFQMNAGLELDSGQFRIDDLDLTFDSTDVNGDIEWIFSEEDNKRPDLHVELSVGKLNFDRMFSFDKKLNLASLLNTSQSVENMIAPWRKVATNLSFKKLELAGVSHNDLTVNFTKSNHKISTMIKNIQLNDEAIADATLSSDWSDGPPLLSYDVELRAQKLLQFVSADKAEPTIPIIKSIMTDPAIVKITGKGTASSVETELSIDTKSMNTNLRGPLQLSLLSNDGPRFEWLIGTGYADFDGHLWDSISGLLSYDPVAGFSLTEMGGDMFGGNLSLDVIENSKEDLNIRVQMENLCPEMPLAEFSDWVSASACISGNLNGVLGVRHPASSSLTNYASGDLSGTFGLKIGNVAQNLPDGMVTRLTNNLLDHFPNKSGAFKAALNFRENILELKDGTIEGIGASGTMNSIHNFLQDRIETRLEIREDDKEEVALSLDVKGPRLEPNVKVNGAWLAP